MVVIGVTIATQSCKAASVWKHRRRSSRRRSSSGSNNNNRSLGGETDRKRRGSGLPSRLPETLEGSGGLRFRLYERLGLGLRGSWLRGFRGFLPKELLGGFRVNGLRQFPLFWAPTTSEGEPSSSALLPCVTS